MLVFVFVAIFIAGLMVGRTPEYLGKKIEARDVKLASLSLLVISVFDARPDRAGRRSATGGRPGSTTAVRTGFGEILYAFASGDRQQRLGVRGADDDAGQRQHHVEPRAGIVILFGRFFTAIPVLALAGALVAEEGDRRRTPGSFPVTGATFVVLLVSTVSSSAR